MPCFKGLAVSIHTPAGPLPEYSIQRQARVHRISSYIAVPPPTVSAETGQPEQSTFAISITLLIPGLPVPYSAPKASLANPHPEPRRVGNLPSSFERGRYQGAVGPYIPITTSENETIAAYIYFDGRPKEEVATLLRRGEETWVNSRWVGVAGGGLAEREFLFREVGLERWLNGLDLSGKDAAAQIERRRLKMEGKRRRRKRDGANESDDDGHGPTLQPRTKMPLSDDALTSDDSDDDPIPESTGQIKVALYRVLASGEIRRGEYSPQFDAQDGDDGGRTDGKAANSTEKEEVDHTTSFAEPKTMDASTISTQTVTGIDPQDSPFAVFTFLYRGEKQLQKMGILPNPSKPNAKLGSFSEGKRRSMQDELAKFRPLDSSGLKRFSEMRDPNARTSDKKKDKAGKKQGDDDSDDEHDAIDDILIKMEDPEGTNFDAMLTAEDAKHQTELADAVQKIKLKRQHSADFPNPSRQEGENNPQQAVGLASPPSPTQAAALTNAPLLPSSTFSKSSAPSSFASEIEQTGSPLKKAKSNMAAEEVCGSNLRSEKGLASEATATADSRGIGIGGDVLERIERDRALQQDTATPQPAATASSFTFGPSIIQSDGPPAASKPSDSTQDEEL